MTALRKIDLLKQKFQESYFRKKTVPKLLSVLFAIIFWLYVMDQVNPEMVRVFPNVPVDVVNLESVEQNSYKILGSSNYTVTAKVKGRRKAVMGMKPEDIVLSIDLKNVKKGLNQIPIERKLYSDAVEFDSLSENRIPITIDQIITASKKVEILTTGALPEGAQLGQMSIAPDRITVKGPETYINKINKIIGTLDLTTAKDNMSISVNLSPVDSSNQLVEGVELSESQVLCSFGVLRTLELPIQAEVKGALPSTLALTGIQVTPANIRLSGNNQLLTDLKKIATEAIDLSAIDQSVEVEQAILMPNGVSAVDGTTKVKVRITVETIDLKEIDYQGNEIILKNIPASMQVKLKDPGSTIKVKVKGAKSLIEKLDASSLKLVVDCSNVKTGSLSLPLEFEQNLAFAPEMVATPSQVEVLVTKK